MGTKTKPNTTILEILVKPCILDINVHLEFKTQEAKNRTLQVYNQYVDDLLPLYFGLFTNYLLTLKNQTQYTFEDIEVFSQVMQLF